MSIRRAGALALACLCLLAMALKPSPTQAVSPSAAWFTEASPPAGNTIIDIAVSPHYAQDGTLFMLTWDGAYSLWRSRDAAASWQRVFTSSGGVDSVDRVALSPDYGTAGRVVYLCGGAGGHPAVWCSLDGGDSFVLRQVPLGLDYIDQWLVLTDSVLLLAGYDGSQALVYSSTDTGVSYGAPVPAGAQPLCALAASPDFGRDGIILAGNIAGGVLWSADGGASFQPVAAGALTDNINVAFDPLFGSNRMVYAASDSSSGGIYRTVLSAGQTWERLDSGLSGGGLWSGLAVSGSGALYAASSRAVNAASGQGGMLRCLSPALGSPLERVMQGLDAGATLWGLERAGNRLWSIDTTHNRLLSFVDSLSLPVNLRVPSNGASGIGTASGNAVAGIALFWDSLPGATSYQWQLSTRSDFSLLPPGFAGSTGMNSVNAPPLVPECTYYWRVRAAAPLYSPWSAAWSFTTLSLSVDVKAPTLENPSAAAIGVSLRPSFRWGAVAGAVGYELVVSARSDLVSPLISRTGSLCLSAASWQADADLSYDTAYYWRVRAVHSSGFSPWSATGHFTTQTAPAPPASTTQAPPLPPAPTLTVLAPLRSLTSEPPAGSAAVELTTCAPPIVVQARTDVPGWVFYLIVLLGVVIVLLLAVLLLAICRRPKLL